MLLPRKQRSLQPRLFFLDKRQSIGSRLGHAHIATTMDVYTHATPAHQRAAVERMAELVTNGDELPVWSVDSELENTCIQ